MSSGFGTSKPYIFVYVSNACQKPKKKRTKTRLRHGLFYIVNYYSAYGFIAVAVIRVLEILLRNDFDWDDAESHKSTFTYTFVL